ncbi:MAG: sensor histidine kinase [Candidatus Dormibacteria bacterium]
MKTELELALRPGRSAGDLQTRVTRALAGVDRMTRVISELLMLARDDQGRLLVRPEMRDLGVLVAAGLSSFRGRAQPSRVLLVLSVEPGLMVEVDELWFRHALDNLLDNALRSAPSRSSLEVVVRSADGEAVVEVSDQGPGFPPAIISQPWQRFGAKPTGTRPDAESNPGTGLGLWIVAMIMTAHHGRAELANRPGGGATVSLHLPSVAVARPPVVGALLGKAEAAPITSPLRI